MKINNNIKLAVDWLYCSMVNMLTLWCEKTVEDHLTNTVYLPRGCSSLQGSTATLGEVTPEEVISEDAEAIKSPDECQLSN